MNRIELANYIVVKIEQEKLTLINQYNNSKDKIGYFYIDNLLPKHIAHEIYNAFPKKSDMVLKKSLKEDKYIAVQMDLYNPLLEEIIYAFQDKRVVNLIGEITNTQNILPDHNLYAGGISVMAYKQFLNPHLDNSHDKDRNLWRVFNLLYYVSPNWELEYGANLELWPNGLKEEQITIHSKYNRLVVMATHNKAIHSVSPVNYDGNRCCVSNYYFSNTPLLASDAFHVTSFRGRPESKFVDILLQADTFVRMGIRKIFKKGIKENPHYYKGVSKDE